LGWVTYIHLNAMKNKVMSIMIIMFVVVVVKFTIIFYMPANLTPGESLGGPVAGAPVRREFVTFRTLFHPFAYPPTNNAVLTLHLENYAPGSVRPHDNQILTIRQEGITSLAALYEAVKNAKSNVQISVELVRERYIVIRTDIHGLQYAMISDSLITGGTVEVTSDGGRMFGYMPLQGRFFDKDVFALDFWQIEGENYTIYVPYPLFDDHLLFYLYDSQAASGLHKNHDLSHQIGHYYRVYGNIADFRAFYETLNLYEVKEGNGQLVLEGQIYRRESGEISATTIPVNGRIILNFKEKDEQYYVSYSFKVGD